MHAPCTTVLTSLYGFSPASLHFHPWICVLGKENSCEIEFVKALAFPVYILRYIMRTFISFHN